MAKRRGGLVQAAVEVTWPDHVDFSELNRAIYEDLEGIADRVVDGSKANLAASDARDSEHKGGTSSRVEIAANIKKRRKDADTIVVEAKHPLAHLEEFGTDPHTIKPKRSKVLVWSPWGVGSARAGSFSQETHFATVVEHPGAKANPFLRPALEAEINELLRR
jgi:hypothetical protein